MLIHDCHCSDIAVYLSLDAAAHLPEMEAAKKRTAELESQLGEKTTQLGTAEKERDRLATVETELQAKIQKLTSDLAAQKTTHDGEMQNLMNARIETEGQLQKERDLAVKGREDAIAQYQQELRAAQEQVDSALACLHRVDIALAGIFSC